MLVSHTLTACIAAAALAVIMPGAAAAATAGSAQMHVGAEVLDCATVTVGQASLGQSACRNQAAVKQVGQCRNGSDDLCASSAPALVARQARPAAIPTYYF